MGLIRKKLFGSNASSSNYAEPTLEKIVSDAAAENEYSLYKLVNYRRGGSILEAYAAPADVGGAKAVDLICQEQLAEYLYAGGAGGTVHGSDCIAWRRRKRGEVAVPMFKSSKSDANDQLPCNVPTDHPGCWLLNQRGVLGENPLHILVICDTPTHTKVAKILLRHYPKLACDVMECREYYGLSPLHLAVAYNNMELVQALVEAGANVNERATGRFFMPSDQKERLKKKTNYSGFTYLGEYPLSWAACCENEAVYNYLLDRGADPNLQDTFGNMILHMVVISNKSGMYGYALRHPKKPANNEILNRAGLTPLTLACTLGRNNIFCEMLELSSQEFWRFSNITCSAYPLIALDSIGPDGRTNWKSALMIILNGESDEHLDMLEGGVVLRLLDDKWKTFARNQFLIRLIFLFLHLLVVSIAVYLRPKFGESLGWSDDPKSIIRHCAEFVTIISCAIFVFVQQGSEIRSQGFFQFTSNLVRSPAKLFFLISNIAILVCIPFRVFHMRLVEDSMLTFALPGTWFFLMFFAGSVRLTGAFVTMIYSMIAGDMVRFGFIYVIALIGFSQAFFFLFKSCRVGIQEAGETNIDMYETYSGTWMALVQMTMGRYQYGDFSMTKYSGLSMGFFVVFMVLVPILLLNVLIAMMSSTYSNVISKSEKEFVKQWAKIVLAVERSVPADKAKEHLNTYAINLAPPPGFDTESGMEFKGLMVIKSKSKTKAQQRKGALLNWRRMGKRLVGDMRKYSCKGNELLKRMKDETAKKATRRGSLTQLMESVDQDYETPNPAPKGGLGEALSQLAFAHDIEITGVTTTNAPLSPSATNNQNAETFQMNSKPVNESPTAVKALVKSPDGIVTMEKPSNDKDSNGKRSIDKLTVDLSTRQKRSNEQKIAANESNGVIKDEKSSGSPMAKANSLKELASDSQTINEISADKTVSKEKIASTVENLENDKESQIAQRLEKHALDPIVPCRMPLKDSSKANCKQPILDKSSLGSQAYKESPIVGKQLNEPAIGTHASKANSPQTIALKELSTGKNNFNEPTIEHHVFPVNSLLTKEIPKESSNQSSTINTIEKTPIENLVFEQHTDTTKISSASSSDTHTRISKEVCHDNDVGKEITFAKKPTVNESTKQHSMGNQSTKQLTNTNQSSKELVNASKEPSIANQLPKESTISNQLLEESTIANQLPEESTIANLLAKESTVANQLPKESTIANQLPKESTNANKESSIANPKEFAIPDLSSNESKIAHQSPKDLMTANQLPKKSTFSHQLPEESTMANQLPKEFIISNQLPTECIISNQLPTECIISNQLQKELTISDQLSKESTIENQLPKECKTSNQLPKQCTIENQLTKESTIENQLPKESTNANQLSKEHQLLNQLSMESTLINPLQIESTIVNPLQIESTIVNQLPTEYTLANQLPKACTLINQISEEFTMANQSLMDATIANQLPNAHTIMNQSSDEFTKENQSSKDVIIANQLSVDAEIANRLSKGLEHAMQTVAQPCIAKKILKQPSFEIHPFKESSPERVTFKEFPVPSKTPSFDKPGFKEPLDEVEPYKAPETRSKPAELFVDVQMSAESLRPKTAPVDTADGGETAGVSSGRLKKPKRRVAVLSTPSRKARRTGFTSRIRKLASRVEPSPDGFCPTVATVETECERLEAAMSSRPQTASSVGLSRGLNRWSTKPVVSLECLMDWHDKELDRDSP